MINNNQNIPQGYKNSSLGVIPQEWEVKRLGDLVEIRSGESPSLFNLASSGKYPYVKVEDMNNCEKYQTHSREYSDNEKSIIVKGSVIFPKRGAAILNNKVRIAGTNIQMDSNMMAITPAENKVLGEYLYFRVVCEQLFKIADTSTIPQINNKHIIPYKLPVPPLGEQRRIAEVLGCWDEAIERQGRMVELLTTRKRALMQRLLSPQTHWQKTKLGEIAKIKKGIQVNKIDLDNEGQYPTINGGIDPSGYSDNYNTSENTITISEGGNSCGYVGYITSKFWCGGHCYAIFCNKLIDKIFLYQLLKSKEAEIMALRVGSGLPNIQMGPLQKFKLIIPAIAEQKSIAEKLSTADAEIDLARRRLDLLRTQKRALMQQLLTGKKRLKYDI